MDLSQMPPGAIPGLAYNSLQSGTVIAFAITYFFCTVFLVLRYFQAFKLVKEFEMDLFILTLAMACALYYFITVVQLMSHGWGRHFTELNTTDFYQFSQVLLPNTIIYLITPAITKMAMLFVLFKINPATFYRALVVFIGVSIFAYTLTLTSITGGPCNPDKGLESIGCLQNVALSQAILNIASDLAVITLPFPTIFSLQFSLRTKITVCCMLGLGSMVIICSIARLPYVIKLSGDSDITYTQAILGVWTIVEVNLGIFCGCAMRLKPFFVRYLPAWGLFSSRSQTRASSGAVLGGGGNWTSSKKEPKGTDPRNTQHAYQLHSIQKSSTDPSDMEDGNIHVQREYELHSEQERVSRIGDMGNVTGGSTDSILSYKK